ncbi:MAG: FAD-binding oxidoreductase [Myxococcota bacterium]|jgi:alkyldihydroxyacetonephosphate synthase
MSQNKVLDGSILGKLAAIVGADSVSTLQSDTFAYSRDLWPKSIIQLREGKVPFPPGAVVWPSTEAQVVALVKLANAEKLPIIPFGAGSGVCGGTLPVLGGVVVDVKRLNAISVPNPVNMTCDFGPGAIGQHAEMEMARQGYTIGHFPSSIYCSSVGGWIAARGAGQESSRYGKIEDMVVSMRFVTGEGELIDTATIGTPDQANPLNQIITGSEGTLGIITKARLRIHRTPRHVLPRGTLFPDVARAVEAIRMIFRLGIRPTVVRLYDEFDTLIGFGKDKVGEGPKKVKKSGGFLGGIMEQLSIPGDITETVLRQMLSAPSLLNRLADYMPGGCMLVTVFSGPDAGLLGAEQKTCMAIFESLGGKDQGTAPGTHWLGHRHNVSYKQSKIFHTGGFVDTMEVAAPWERIIPLYWNVRKAVSPHAFIMAHFSHAYGDGCSIYFTFVGVRKDGQAEALYDRIWNAAQGAVHKSGATVSHHHGIGVHKARFMPNQHEGGLPYFRAVKHAFDPENIMNPGKLGL